MKKLFLPLFSGLLLVSCTQQKNRAAVEASAIATALEAHYVEYGTFPPEINRAATAAILGGNSRGIIFMEASPGMLNSSGELIDPWGTPYRFTFLPDLSLIVLSAGFDRTFGTADDISRLRKKP